MFCVSNVYDCYRADLLKKEDPGGARRKEGKFSISLDRIGIESDRQSKAE